MLLTQGRYNVGHIRFPALGNEYGHNVYFPRVTLKTCSWECSSFSRFWEIYMYLGTGSTSARVVCTWGEDHIST